MADTGGMRCRGNKRGGRAAYEYAGHKRYEIAKLAEVDGEFEVVAAAGEVIGRSPLLAVGVGNPEIGIDVLPADKIEDLKLDGPLLDVLGRRLAHELGRLGIENIGGTEVDALIHRHAAPRLTVARRIERLAFGELHLQVELELRQARDVVLEEHGEVIAGFRGAGDP